MEFKRENVIDVFNADKAIVGSYGYFFDYLIQIKKLVEYELDSVKAMGYYGKLVKVLKEVTYPFCMNSKEDYNECSFQFFYPVKVPEERESRPFRDIDELKDTFCKRFNVTVKETERPLIWVTDKSKEHERLITYFGSAVSIAGMGTDLCSMVDLHREYTFLDGSPCGIEE